MAKLYVVRHGTTHLNSEEKIRSWADPSLDRKGREEAVKIGEFFKNKPINLIYSSDLKRASETAHEISRNTRAPIMSTATLRPLNYGSLTGSKVEDVRPELEELSRRWEENPDIKAPKGESFTNFQDRMRAVIESVLKQMKSSDNIVLSGHSRTINYMREYVNNNRQPLKGKEISSVMRDSTNPGTIDEYLYDPTKNELKLGEKHGS